MCRSEKGDCNVLRKCKKCEGNIGEAVDRFSSMLLH